MQIVGFGPSLLRTMCILLAFWRQRLFESQLREKNIPGWSPPKYTCGIEVRLKATFAGRSENSFHSCLALEGPACWYQLISCANPQFLDWEGLIQWSTFYFTQVSVFLSNVIGFDHWSVHWKCWLNQGVIKEIYSFFKWLILIQNI